MNIFYLLLILAQVASVPTPAELPPHWWEYYDVQEPQLQERIDETLDNLQQVEEQLGEEERAQAALYIERIRINLESLRIARERSATPPTPLPDPKESYTIKEQVTLLEELRQAKKELSAKQANLEYRKASIAAVEEKLSTLIRRYLDLPDPTSRKVLLGLQIMALESGMEAKRKDQELLQTATTQLKTRVSGLRELLERSGEHLDVTTENGENLAAVVAAKQEAVTAAQVHALRVESDAIGIDDDEKEALEVEQIVEARIQAALAQVELIVSQAHLALLSLRKGNGDPSALLRQAEAWERELDGLSTQVRFWRKRVYLFRQPQDVLLQLGQLDQQLDYGEVLVDQLRRTVNSQRGPVLSTLFQISEAFGTLPKKVGKWLSYPLFKVKGVPFTLGTLLQVIITIIIAYVISRLLQAGLRRLWKSRPHLSKGTLYPVGRVLHYIIMTLGLIIALTGVGIDLNALMIVIGALAVGIGFGLQGIVNNFFAGFICLFSKTVRIGDVIQLESGQIGTVTEMRMQQLTMRTLSGKVVIVPNTQVVTNRFENWTYSDPYVRLELPFSVAYGSDPEKIQLAGYQAIDRVPATIRSHPKVPDPLVYLHNFGSDGLECQLMVWINLKKTRSFNKIRAQYYWELEKSFRDNGLTVPYPQRDLHFKNKLP